MKKITLFAFVILSTISFAQQQVINGSFETWENVGSATEEPNSWNGTKTGSGVVTNPDQNLFQETNDVHSGNFSARIESTTYSIFFNTSLVNGMLTTGNVGIAGFSASGGFNQTLTGTAGKNHPLPNTDSPDSLVFWAKYTPQGGAEARVQALLHTNYDQKTPTSNDGNSDNNVDAEAVLNFGSTGSAWQRFSLPFDYNVGGASSHTHVLFAITAVAEVGGSTSKSGSVLLIDDLEFIYNPPAPVTAFTASASSTCLGNSISFTDNSTNAPTSWSWNFGDGNTSSSQNPSHTYATAGMYTVELTATNASGSNSTTQSVTVNALPATPTISTSGQTTFCQGGSIDLTSSATSGNEWSTNETNQTISVNTTGNYSVTVTDANGCEATSAITSVTVNPLPVTPTISASGQTTFCQGGSVDLTSSATSGNEWSTNETNQTISVNATGNYSVTVTDVNGCEATSAITAVTVNALPATPTILTSGQTTFCQGDSVTLTSSVASGNEWSTNETNQTISVNATGNYSVTVTDPNGCEATSAITAVTVNALPTTPTISASGQTTFCQGGAVDLTSSVTSGNEWSTNETNQTISVNTTGNYSVTVTDPNGCEATSAITAVTVNALPATPTISASGQTTFCQGGSVNLTSSANSGNEWSTNETNQTISVNVTGNYSVTVTDPNGCEATSAITAVTVNTLPTISVGTVTSPSACGNNDGSIEITGSGTGNISWTGNLSGNVSGQSLPYTIPNLSAGAYSISFTENGCTSQVNEIVNDPSSPNAPTITASGQTTFCQGDSVILTSSVNSGNDWSTNETTESIKVNSTGVYSVTVTDGNGCSATSAPISITVNTLPATPTISTSGQTTFCQGTAIDLTSSVTSGNEWSTNETTESITVNATGNYSVTVTDANGCEATSAITAVTVNPLPATPTISASGQTTFCQGGAVDLTSSATSGNEWPTNETNQTISVNTTGNYSVTVTDANGCEATSAITAVTVNPLPATPTISASGQTTFCQGDSVILTSSAASGNEWSSNETTESITVNATGNYSVTVTDANGCDATSAITAVTVNALPITPTISASGQTTFCQGGAVDLTSSANSGNEWSTNETNQTISVNTTGNYSVTVTDANGCEATSAITAVTVNALPSVSLDAFDPDTICVNQPIFILPAGTPAGGTYSGNGVSSSNFEPAVAGIGTHVITYEYSNGTCSESATAIIVVDGCSSIEENTIIQFSMVPNPATDVVTINLNNKINGTIAIIDLSGKVVYNSGINGLENIISVSNLNKGMYFVQVTDENGNQSGEKLMVK